jgi:Xaa-Pro aminopeptidase
MDIKTILSAVAKAYKNFKKNFSVGKTTDELFENFSGSLKESLGEYKTVYDYIWGKDTLNIDGITKGYIPKKGDTVIMDISVGVDGVWCDVCRTFFVGEISSEQRKSFELIKNTVRAGHSALKPSATAESVYLAVNSVYSEKGKTLVHHAGHQIGNEPLMQPQFLEGRKEIIEEGKTYTIESGLYEGFGIRLENNYLVNKEGAEDLFEDLLPLDIEEYLLK